MSEEPLSIVCWKWKPRPGYRSTFAAEHVNTLARMVARHYPKPHRVICVTDDDEGIDRAIGIVPLWDDLASLPSPHGGNNPSCYRRLKAFSVEAADWFGPRFVSIDLDCVIVGDLRPVWDRPEPFVIWGDSNRSTFYNGGMWMMTAGARRQVWERFDPRTSPRAAYLAGQFGSDQAWISHCLGDGEARWRKDHGVVSYRLDCKPLNGRLPAGARIVMFHGQHDPWGADAQRLDWVREHYR